MSWSAYLASPVKVAADEAAIRAELDDFPWIGAFGASGVPAYMEDQFEKAKDATAGLLASGVLGAVGDTGDYFLITMSGHGNPDHQPAAGWANDTVTVSIVQASAPDEPAAA